MTDITALMATMKAAAEKATPGEWRRASTQFNGITATPFVLGGKEVMIAAASEKRDAEFITAVSPANVLALVEALEARDKQIVELEKSRKSWAELADDVEQMRKSWADIAIEKGKLADDKDKRIAELESRTVTVSQNDYFAYLVAMARVSADKAMRKFPQPNYVLLKVAEEAGEVVQAGVHYAEKRMAWKQVEGEIIQLLAMLIRLVTEGDQINGITPPAAGIKVIEGEQKNG